MSKAKLIPSPPKVVRIFVHSIFKIDEDGQRFRYPYNKNGMPFKEASDFASNSIHHFYDDLMKMLQTFDYFEVVHSDIQQKFFELHKNDPIPEVDYQEPPEDL